MGFNANGPFNAQIRQAGARSRALIPNIGQDTPPASTTPASTPMPAPQMPQGPSMVPGYPGQPPTQNPQAPAPPMQAPAIQPQTFTIHPPGAPADPNQYNYEPQPDGSWRVYPPGVMAPSHTANASLPRAASTGDYIRMSRAFSQGQRPQPNPMGPQPAPQPGI